MLIDDLVLYTTGQEHRDVKADQRLYDPQLPRVCESIPLRTIIHNRSQHLFNNGICREQQGKAERHINGDR